MNWLENAGDGKTGDLFAFESSSSFCGGVESLEVAGMLEVEDGPDVF
jgi:hypothetical protein